MTIIAELRVSGTGTVLVPALQSAPGMVLELERSVVTPDEDPVLFLWGHGGDFDALESAIPDDRTVKKHEVVHEGAESRLYRVVVDTGETVDSASLDRKVGASRLEIRATAEGITVKSRFPDWAALQRYVDLVRESGLDISLRTVYPAEEEHHAQRYGLSEKQWETLDRARKAGYFGVPRETDLATLAAELGISKQAASERLRRGMAALLDATLGEVAPPGEPAETSTADGCQENGSAKTPTTTNE